MAQEHETHLTRDNDSQYRQVITLGSASSWGRNHLDLFQVHFDRNSYDPLPSEVLEYTTEDDDGEESRSMILM